MKIKKIISPLINSILILNLNACATTTPPIHYTQSQRDAFSQQLVTPAINKTMDESDRVQLVQYIGSAKPGSINKWKNKKTGNTYQFISRTIYLNGQGQPCHSYILKEHTGLFNHFKTIETACRNENGHWRVR